MPNTKFGVLLCLGLALCSPAARSQAPYPPPALVTVPSLDAAAALLGAGRAESSGYLLLEMPEISLPGDVEVVMQSELPGTTQLILLRQYPLAPKPDPKAATGRPKPIAPNAKLPKPAPSVIPPMPPTVFVAASQILPGQPAKFTAKVDFQRSERFTLLAYAQGRWFVTAREVKLAKNVSQNSLTPPLLVALH